MLGRYRVAAFPFVEGIGRAPAYWREGDTIDTYWEAHMDLLGPQADFQLSQPEGHWARRQRKDQPSPWSFLARSRLGQEGRGDEYPYPQGCLFPGVRPRRHCYVIAS